MPHSNIGVSVWCSYLFDIFDSYNFKEKIKVSNITKTHI